MALIGRLTRLRFLVGTFILSVAVSTAWAFTVPTLTAPVIDSAGVMQSDEIANLDISLRRLRDAGGPQINVLTVETLDGIPIETASIQVTDTWKLGGRKEDDGVLLLVALKERKIRIEVGQGLEGSLTDLHSKQIIEDVMVPFFKTGRPSDGIIAGVQAIIERVAPDKLASLGERPPSAKRERRSGGLPIPVLILIFILFALFGGGRGGRGRGARDLATGLALGALAGRGGWGGHRGGSGGGSWGGGGGGFSGGGASGGW